jgi:hypothetical protein
VAAAALAGVAAVFVFLHGGSSAAPSPSGTAATSASRLTSDRLTGALHRQAAEASRLAGREAGTASRVHRSVAQLVNQPAATPPPAQAPAPAPGSSSPPVLSSGGGDAAHSALGNCIRQAEEGGSYAWGPGNGGGAYQFQLATWEHYGGAASAYGSAGPAYQDQIFDNAIAAGGASNWTNYDGC